MIYDERQHHRRSIRLRGYDYTQAGAYFITVCTHDGACVFGDVVDGVMQLNECGAIVRDCWMAIPDHFLQTALDEFVIMPNHVHGIVVLVGATHDPVGATHASPLPGDSSPGRPRGPQRRSIGSIIGSFKSAVTKRINERRGTPGAIVWQRNYYEHIIRTDESLTRIREYILTNPLRWHLDRENRNCMGKDEGRDSLFGTVGANKGPWP